MCVIYWNKLHRLFEGKILFLLWSLIHPWNILDWEGMDIDWILGVIWLHWQNPGAFWNLLENRWHWLVYRLTKITYFITWIRTADMDWRLCLIYLLIGSKSIQIWKFWKVLKEKLAKEFKIQFSYCKRQKKVKKCLIE